MGQKFANNAVSQLASAITDTQTQFAVLPGAGGKFPVLAEGDWFMATIVAALPDGGVQREIVKVNVRANDQFTVDRGQENTQALPFAGGTIIEARWTAGSADAIWTAMYAGGVVTGEIVQKTASQNTYRTVSGNYGVFTRVDGTSAFLMQTASGDPKGTFNGFRPFSWGLASGEVTIAGNGSNTNIGGLLNVLGALTVTGQINAKQRVMLVRDGQYGEMGIRSTDGSVMYIRGRSGGGGMEWVNSAYNAVPATMDDGGNLSLGAVNSRGRVTAQEHLWSFNNVYAGNGGAWMGTDGNLYGGVWGGWLSSWLSNQLGGRADRNANCQWNSGAIETGFLSPGQESATDLPAPYVCVGFHTRPANWVALRGVFLRNN